MARVQEDELWGGLRRERKQLPLLRDTGGTGRDSRKTGHREPMGVVKEGVVPSALETADSRVGGAGDNDGVGPRTELLLSLLPEAPTLPY